jgi:hypothetical protein
MLVRKIAVCVAAAALLAAGGTAYAGATSTATPVASIPATAPHAFHTDKVLAAAAATIGIPYSSLRQAMRAKQTIAEIASAHGVDPARVIAAMVAVAERDFGVAAAAVTSRRSALRYRDAIPRIMERFVYGQANRVVHKGVRAKAIMRLRISASRVVS